MIGAVVIGGGLHGLSTAIHLTQKGVRTVLVEKNVTGRHASSVNAGGVRRLRRDPAEIPLAVEALERWMNLSALLGRHAPLCGFVSGVGQVAVAENDADMRWIEQRAAELHALGWTHEEVIDRAELRRLVPALAEHCLGGLISRQDGHAVPYLTSQAFRLRALELGVELHEQTRVTGLEQEPAAWRVQTSRGAFEAELVVNCGGAWGWQVAELVGEPLPRTYFAPSMMVTARMPHFLEPVVLGIGRKLSFKQSEVGTVVIGGGINGTPDLEKEVADPRPERLPISARTVCDLFPIMRRAVVVRTWAGLEARMPDEIPVIGPSTVVNGLFHAFGFSGHGFALAPIVGALMAELIVDGRSSLPIEAFRANRFNNGGNS
jgi:sarcosine oxidase, subunit beta